MTKDDALKAIKSQSVSEIVPNIRKKIKNELTVTTCISSAARPAFI
jgi:hypothetical protein